MAAAAANSSFVFRFDDRGIVVQVLVLVFLCIDFLLMAIFFSKEAFYSSMRYILFAITLFHDIMNLIMGNLLLILMYFRYTMHPGPCLIVCCLLSISTYTTPVALTAMTLERYVAICLPLRHSELCNLRNAHYSNLLIHGLGSVPCIIVNFLSMASVTSSIFSRKAVCTVEIFLEHRWQSHLRSAIGQLYFLVMVFAIVLSYVKMMKVAKSASGENRKSSWKGLRTVTLHAFQLLLCLIRMWCPIIEGGIRPISVELHRNVRYMNYILFSLTPRCLSPVIYGLRDEMFHRAVINFVLCGWHKKRQFS